MTQCRVFLVLTLLFLGFQLTGCGHPEPSYETNIGQQGTEGIPAEDGTAREKTPIPESKDEWNPPVREGTQETP